MRLGIDYGRQHLDFEVSESKLIGVHRQPIVPPIMDRPVAVRAALETPLGFPALRRALTPDDHVTIVVDESLPHLAELVIPLLEHITAAAVHPEAITLLCAPPLLLRIGLTNFPTSSRRSASRCMTRPSGAN